MLFWIVCILACGDTQTPKGAQIEVKQAATVHELTAKEINTILLSRKNGDPSGYGKIYEVTGTIQSLSISEKIDPSKQEKGTNTQQSEYAILYIMLPDYAGATIKCHFDISDKDQLKSLAPKSLVKIRGKLSDKVFFQESSIDLNGCIIMESKPTRSPK